MADAPQIVRWIVTIRCPCGKQIKLDERKGRHFCECGEVYHAEPIIHVGISLCDEGV